MTLDEEVDQLLAQYSVADVILAAESATPGLERAAQTSAFKLVSVSAALDAFDLGQAPRLGTLSGAQARELEQHLNAFALRTRLDLIEGRRNKSAPLRSERTQRNNAPIGMFPVRSPDEVLAQTTLRTIIVTSAGGVALRMRLKKWLSADLFDMTASEFLADDDAEAHFREALDTRGFLDLCELVNAFAWVTHHGGSVD